MDVQKIPKGPLFYIFRHYATYRKLQKKIRKKIRKIFFSIFSFLRAFVSSCRKSGLRVFLSLRYGADLGRSRLVLSFSCLLLSFRVISGSFLCEAKHSRPYKGKMPDSYSDLFLQTTDITLIGPLFTETTKSTKAKSGQCKLSAKDPPFIFLT